MGYQKRENVKLESKTFYMREHCQIDNYLYNGSDVIAYRVNGRAEQTIH